MHVENLKIAYEKKDLYTTTIQGLPVKAADLINHGFSIHRVYLSLVWKG